MAKKKCPDPEAHEKGDLLFPCDHFGAPITDKARLDFLIENPLIGFAIFGRAGQKFLGEICKDCKTVREAIDAVIEAERRAKKGAK